MSDLIDYLPDEDRQWLVESDAEQILSGVRDSEWLADDPGGDDDYGRDESA